MERREPPGGGAPNADGIEKAPNSGRPRSHQENGRASAGTRLENRNDIDRGETRRENRRDMRRGRDRSYTDSSGEENPRFNRGNDRNKKVAKNLLKKKKNSARQARRMRELVRLSGTSKAIPRRLVPRRKTRTSVNPSRYKGTKETEGEEEKEVVPAIPRRVFKALYILRHEKFLRVASRYLKPKKVAKKFQTV